MLRRLLFAVLLVFGDKYPNVQIIFTMYLSIFYMIFNSTTKPFRKKRDNWNEAIGEVLVLLTALLI